MNMLTNFTIVSIHRNTIQFKVQTTCTLEDLFQTFCISKARKKYFLCRETIFEPNKIYTIYTQIKQDEMPCIDQSIDIVYEDNLLLIVNKPTDLLVHTDGNTIDTLTARVHYYALIEQLPFYPMPLHRIDKETSGLVLYSKQPFFHAFFDQQIAEHHIKKTYLAIVKGNFPFKTKQITKPIARNRHNAKKMMCIQSGKPAHTKITRVSAKRNTSLLKVKITTGRKHQIRVHLQSLGYPIYNDPLYGTIYDNRKLLLESYQVTFFDPIQKKSIEVTAPIDLRFHPYTNNDLKESKAHLIDR